MDKAESELLPLRDDDSDDYVSEFFFLGTGTRTPKDHVVENDPLSISDTTNDDDAGHESTDDADADDDADNDEELHHLEV